MFHVPYISHLSCVLWVLFVFWVLFVLWASSSFASFLSFGSFLSVLERRTGLRIASAPARDFEEGKHGRGPERTLVDLTWRKLTERGLRLRCFGIIWFGAPVLSQEDRPADPNMAQCSVFALGPTHVAEQERPQPYSKELNARGRSPRTRLRKRGQSAGIRERSAKAQEAGEKQPHSAGKAQAQDMAAILSMRSAPSPKSSPRPSR